MPTAFINSFINSFTEQTTNDISWVPGTWVLRTQVVSKTGTDLLSWNSHSWGSWTGSNGRADEGWGSEDTEGEGWRFGIRYSRKPLEKMTLIRDRVR